MAEEYIIVNLSNVLGYLLEDVAQFVGNIFAGWMFIMLIFSLAFMIVIYFRFFKSIPKQLRG